ncbi:MAG: CBS domain-containing protein [Anaerolineaceae bacterium]
MTTVEQLLKKKGSQVWSVSPTTSIIAALRLLAEKDIGALLVMDGERMVGILSERDFARSIARTSICNLDLPVDQMMTREVITITPDQQINACMQLMTEKKIRHLPVMENGVLVGIISIGDVVKEIITSQESSIEFLRQIC